MMKQAQELATTGRIDTHCDTTMELSDEDWDRMLRVHLYGTFYCSREALKIMSRQSGELCSGKIINMGSIMGTAAGAALSTTARQRRQSSASPARWRVRWRRERSRSTRWRRVSSTRRFSMICVQRIRWSAPRRRSGALGSPTTLRGRPSTSHHRNRIG